VSINNPINNTVSTTVAEQKTIVMRDNPVNLDGYLKKPVLPTGTMITWNGTGFSNVGFVDSTDGDIVLGYNLYSNSATGGKNIIIGNNSALYLQNGSSDDTNVGMANNIWLDNSNNIVIGNVDAIAGNNGTFVANIYGSANKIKST
jgi:hypothetical protein